ncbi:MAG: cofactor-independent phosphoglycerate mutase [bacterium]|jgi:2,3-bisphosphoglycerate-independent phosphoglycerate mutase
MSKGKTIIFLGDGMADEPMAELGGKTPLQVAHTPGMDRIAREGRSGTLLTLPEGFPTSSEVANMSVMGCDLPTEYCGRGALEAAGRGIPLVPSDVAFRVNLTTVEEGVLRDFSGGRIGSPDAALLIQALNEQLGSSKIRFYTGLSYRNILICSGSEFSAQVKTDKPDDNHGQRIAEHLPRALSAEGEVTAEVLRRLMQEATAVLTNHPINQRQLTAGLAMANGIWPWSGGRAGALKSLKDKYGITGAVISAVDVITGLGRCLGLDVVPVPGATGYIDTNYEGKAAAAVEAIKTHDFVYLHLEAIDEVSHEQNLALKIKAIEDFDARIICPVMAAVGPEANYAVLPDHPVPICLGKHTRTPVPVSVLSPGVPPDGVTEFNEVDCLRGKLGAMQGDALMRVLFG